MISNVFVTAGSNWRFETASDGRLTALEDKRAYRDRFNQLKSTGAPGPYGLPWPPYVSTLWEFMLGQGYQNTRSETLVALLAPFVATSPFFVDGLSPNGQADAEALRHPFAVTALCTVGELINTPAQRREAVAVLARDILVRRTGDGRQFRDGLREAELPQLPQRDFNGGDVRLLGRPRFRIMSGLAHDDTDPVDLAADLATLFEPRESVDTSPLITRGGAVSVVGNAIGIVLPGSLHRAQQRIKCLHRNTALLVALMENLAAAVTAAEATSAADWYRRRAAVVLNLLHRRAPAAETGSIYKSRCAALWLDARDLPASIDAVNEAAAEPLPPLVARPQAEPSARREGGESDESSA